MFRAVAAAAICAGVAAHGAEFDTTPNAHELWSSTFESIEEQETHGRVNQQAAAITFNKLAISNGEAVTVTASAPWYANTTESRYVWLALYSPPDAPLGSSTPVRYQACIAKSEFNETGVCSFTFKLNNLHSGGYRARLIQGGLSGGKTNISGTLNARPTGQSTNVASGSKPWVSAQGNNGNTASFYGAVIGTSADVVTFVKPNEATHIRVTPGSASGSRFTVSWNQADNSAAGRMLFARDERSLATSAAAVVNASKTSLTTDDVCRLSPAFTTGWRSGGTQWSATADLAAFAGSRVYYTVGDATDTSAVQSLYVPLAPGAPTPFSFLMWADQGVGYTDEGFNGRNYNNGRGALQMAQRAAQHVSGGAMPQAAFMIVSGDMTYADGYYAQTEDYLEMMQPASAAAPILVSSGNHESDYYRNNATANLIYDAPNGGKSDLWATNSNLGNSISSGGECGSAFKTWPQPGATAAAPWYSWSSGLVTVVVWSSEHSFVTGSIQWLWLNATLASINRALTPWVIVTAHRSAYVDSANPSLSWAGDLLVSQMMWQHIDPLLLAYGVQVHYGGHTHVTQRHCAVFQGQCIQNSTRDAAAVNVYRNPNATVFYTLGNAGANSDTAFSGNTNYTAWQSSQQGYATVTVLGRTALEIRVLSVVTGEVLDTARIINGEYNPPSSSAASVTTSVATATVLLLGALFTARA